MTAAKSLSRWSLVLGAMLLANSCVLTEADGADDPVVTFPAWTAASSQSQAVVVVPPEGWTIDRVEYAVDDGEWRQAIPAENDQYVVELVDLDIGRSELALRVESSYRGHSQVDLYYSTIPEVAPSFNCDSPESMKPDATLIQQQGTERRTLLGYFGDPDGGHTATFSISFRNLEGEDHTSVGTIINRGFNSMMVEFDVSEGYCSNWPNGRNEPPVDCNTSYGLSLNVDGVEVCSSSAFGNILDYADGGFN